MWRLYLDAVLIFLIPFAIYSAWNAWVERDPKAALRYSKGPLAWLTLAGLVLVIGTIVFWEASKDRHIGPYQRTIWKDGQLIPAEVK